MRTRGVKVGDAALDARRVVQLAPQHHFVVGAGRLHVWVGGKEASEKRQAMLAPITAQRRRVVGAGRLSHERRQQWDERQPLEPSWRWAHKAGCPFRAAEVAIRGAVNKGSSRAAPTSSSWSKQPSEVGLPLRLQTQQQSSGKGAQS